jgi:transposase
MHRKGAGGGRTEMLGIDVSKAQLSTTLLDARDGRVCWDLVVPNTPAGVQVLLHRTPTASPWVLEPTGHYSGPVARQAQAAGRTVLMASPRRAKAFLAAVRPRAKTDRLDSDGLARYARAVALRPYPLKTPAMEALDQLLGARKGLSQSLARLRQQRASLPAAADALDGAISDLTARLTALDRQIARTRQAALPVAAALLSVPGIGPVTATAVASCLESKDFTHPDQFVAYIGLDMRVRDSGTRRGRRTLSKQGDAELRRLLYLCAQANLRRRDPDNPFRAQYVRERAKGLSSTAALNAVARKLARTCWSLHRYRSSFDPARVNHQPTTPRSDPLLDLQP